MAACDKELFAPLCPEGLRGHVFTKFGTDIYLVTRCSQLLTDEIQPYQQCFYESRKMFITDVLAFKSLSIKYQRRFRKLTFDKDQTKSLIAGHLDTSELV